jgi:alginate O-acetyltransferase complex protein AlgI
MTQVFSYLGMLVGIGTSAEQFFRFTYFLDARTMTILVTGMVLSTPVLKVCAKRFGGTRWYALAQTVGTPALLVLALIFLINSSYSPFLYAQF